MSQVIITQGAVQGLERCRQFLSKKSHQVAQRAAMAIRKQFQMLETAPKIGRPFSIGSGLSELIINFGDSGYVALYRYEPELDTVYILAFRHQKEVGYY